MRWKRFSRDSIRRHEAAEYLGIEEAYGVALPSAEGLDQDHQEAVSIGRQLRNAPPEQAAQDLMDFLENGPESVRLPQ